MERTMERSAPMKKEPDQNQPNTDPLSKTPALADLKSMTLGQLRQFLSAMGEKPYRAEQIYEWLHVRHVTSFEQMTNISKSLRSRLEDSAVLTVLRPLQIHNSRLDGTKKYLFALPDGNVIESVWMKYQHGNSVCISSQVGCRMGCRFCASAIDGFVRNLHVSEMLEQVYRVGQDIGERISHVVVMGMGEPLDNFENLLRFLTMLSDEHGIRIGQRNITVSTCGIIPRIRELADARLSITLALSLHAASQETRRKLMPVAEKYPLQAVIEACDDYFAKTGRRITFEYSLIRGINDAKADADKLSRLLKNKNCHVNLIPVNPVRERPYEQPDREAALAFQNILEKNKINVTIRREMGRDINGACGQLRKSYAAGHGM